MPLIVWAFSPAPPLGSSPPPWAASRIDVLRPARHAHAALFAVIRVALTLGLGYLARCLCRASSASTRVGEPPASPSPPASRLDRIPPPPPRPAARRRPRPFRTFAHRPALGRRAPRSARRLRHQSPPALPSTAHRRPLRPDPYAALYLGLTQGMGVASMGAVSRLFTRRR